MKLVFCETNPMSQKARGGKGGIGGFAVEGPHGIDSLIFRDCVWRWRAADQLFAKRTQFLVRKGAWDIIVALRWRLQRDRFFDFRYFV